MQCSRSNEEKHSIFLELTKLLGITFDLLRGKQSLHFTALSTVNRILDLCIYHRNYESGSLTLSTENVAACPNSIQEPGTTGSGGEGGGGGGGSGGGSSGVGVGGHGGVAGTGGGSGVGGLGGGVGCVGVGGGGSGSGGGSGGGSGSGSGGGGGGGGSSTGSGVCGRGITLRKETVAPKTSFDDSAHLSRKLSSTSKKFVNKDPSYSDRFQDDDDVRPPAMPLNRTPLEIVTNADPSQILNVLHNNITMHKRIIGTRQKCSPSTRRRQCTHHCLQILSARILVVMCHGTNVQHRVVADGHVKTLVEALDPNNDPVSNLFSHN